MDELPMIYVEGKDDQFALINLLEAHGVSFSESKRKVNFKATESVSSMLENLATYIKAAQNQKRPVGFVMDIDFNLESKWEGIRTRLESSGFTVPSDALSEDGAILEFPNAPVGFWLMPDNVSRTGKLEDFLRTLITDDDPVLDTAVSFVGNVKSEVPAERRFRDVDVEKAEMSAWLAVQNPPGVPYGTAIKARMLRPHSPVADRFVTWFKKLYGIDG